MSTAVTYPLGADAPLASSARGWLAMVAVLACVEVLIPLVGAGLERDPRSTLFSWPAIAVVGLTGLFGIWLSHRTGFPAAWQADISNRQRPLYPTVLGIVIGLALGDWWQDGVESGWGAGGW